MISYDDIRQLQQYPSDLDSLVLSLYVNVDQSDAANLNRGFETAVSNLFRRMEENNNSENNDHNRFLVECEKVLEFLKGYTPKGASVVIFSDSRRGFWWHRDLQVKLPTGGRWSQKPWLRPLLEVLEDHDRLSVVLIDKHRAKIMTLDATGIEQLSEIESDVPNKHATTGSDHIMSQAHMERDHANHIKWHARRVADALIPIIDGNKLSRIVIGGPVEATSIFVGEIPKRLQNKIIGTISIPLDAGTERLMSELRAVQEKAELEDENRLVEAMITSAHKGDRAVLGISETLSAIQQGRIHCLVIARDFHVEGKECDSCHVLVSDGLERCSFCGGKLEAAPDLINRASHRVIEQGGKVQIVSATAAEKLAQAGVGAVLRF